MSLVTDADIQRRLIALGYDLGPGGADGRIGPMSRAAIMEALELVGRPAVVAPAPQPPSGLPAAPAAISAQPKASRPVWEIVIHCTATPEGRDVSVETIRGWHLKNGWQDIGYHYVVALDGTVRAGRPEAEIGAHVSGHNTGTIGVVYVGGCDAAMNPKDTRTPAQKVALTAACKALIAKYPAIRKVSGHNEYAPKACPSFDVRKDPLGALV